MDVAVDAAANALYVADERNDLVRVVTLDTQTASTLAGSGLAGFADGTGAAATFDSVAALDIDRTAGVLYVCDKDNHAIRVVDVATAVVTTLAGGYGDGYGNSGALDGVGTMAGFKYPNGIAIDATTGTL